MVDRELKIKQLIALATNAAASPEEARTAALAACRLLTTEFNATSTGEVERLHDDLMSARAKAEQLQHLLNAARLERDRNFREIAALRLDNHQLNNSAKGKAVNDARSNGPKRIMNKYDSYCKACGIRIFQNTMVNWTPGHGITHITCPTQSSTTTDYYVYDDDDG